MFHILWEEIQESNVRFREHRGSLEASLETVVDVDGRVGLLKHIRKIFSGVPEFDDAELKVSPYSGDDHRIYPIWRDTHIVSIDGYGPVGFTEGQAE